MVGRTSPLAPLLATLLAACGGGAAVPALHPNHPAELPAAAADRREIVDALGHRAWDAMVAGDPSRLLYADRDLEVLVQGGAVTRFAARRLAHAAELTEDPERFRGPLASARYSGVCLQGARPEPANGPLGLLADGWVFDRMLVIGTRETGRRVAAWLEGVFVYSDAGFAALDLERVEEPRWEHSDLEIAPCDLSIRDDLPEIAR